VVTGQAGALISTADERAERDRWPVPGLGSVTIPRPGEPHQCERELHGGDAGGAPLRRIGESVDRVVVTAGWGGQRVTYVTASAARLSWLRTMTPGRSRRGAGGEPLLGDDGPQAQAPGPRCATRTPRSRARRGGLLVAGRTTAVGSAMPPLWSGPAAGTRALPLLSPRSITGRRCWPTAALPSPGRRRPGRARQSRARGVETGASRWAGPRLPRAMH